MLTLVSGVVVFLGLTALSALVSDEVKACAGRLARRMTKRATKALPAGDRDRYYEEWLCELDAIEGGVLSKLFWAGWLLVRRRRMAHALGGPAPAAMRIKRMVDITLAMTGLVVTMPAMLVIAVALKLRGGPVFIRQTVPGVDGDFTLLTFRTSGKGELGRFLRRPALDMLPALLNVLRNEISLVGPASYQCVRPEAKPGMFTVGGSSYEGTMDEYLRTWSLKRELSIIVKGVWHCMCRIFRHEHAVDMPWWFSNVILRAMAKQDYGLIVWRARLELEWTQAELAQRFGCSVSMVSQIETGELAFIDVRARRRLCKVLRIPRQLLGVARPGRRDSACRALSSWRGWGWPLRDGRGWRGK